MFRVGYSKKYQYWYPYLLIKVEYRTISILRGTLNNTNHKVIDDGLIIKVVDTLFSMVPLLFTSSHKVPLKKTSMSYIIV